MSVVEINITIEQGEDFSSSFSILNPDESIATLSNYSLLSTLKKHPTASIGVTFSTSLDIDVSVATIALGRTETSSLSPGRHYYDLFLVSPTGIRKKVIEGNAIVNPSATLV